MVRHGLFHTESFVVDDTSDNLRRDFRFTLSGVHKMDLDARLSCD